MIHNSVIRDALRVLVPFVQFKKREKHPWRSVNFSKVAGFKPGWLECYQIAQRSTYNSCNTARAVLRELFN